MADIAGHGTKLLQDATEIADRVSITGPDWAMGERDVTHLDSPMKEYRPTLADPGTLSMQIWWDPKLTSHTLLTDLMQTPEVVPWTLEFIDGSLVTFEGFVGGFAPGGMEPEGTLTADLTVRVTGLITVTPGAGA